MKLAETLLNSFNTYTNNYELEENDREMKLRMLEAAISVVELYLGYDLDEKNYEEEHTSTGTRKIYLYAQPVQNVFSVMVNGIELDPMDYTVYGNYIKTTNQKERFPKDAIVNVEYTAGYGKRIPDLIQQTILRIASLMLQESNSNIGTSGVSLPDGISRSFVSYNNYSKYLQPLEKLRSFEI